MVPGSETYFTTRGTPASAKYYHSKFFLGCYMGGVHKLQLGFLFLTFTWATEKKPFNCMNNSVTLELFLLSYFVCLTNHPIS